MMTRRLAPAAPCTPRTPFAPAALAALAALVVLASPALAGDPDVKPGKWNKRDVPAGWVVVDGEHYHVQCEAGREKAEALLGHLESMWEVYSQFLPFRRKPPTFVLKIFADVDGYHDYGGRPGSAAYYDRGRRELVGYDTGVILGRRDIPARVRLWPGAGGELQGPDRERLDALFERITDEYTMDTAGILSHEGWHQYFHNYTVSWVAMPSWLDEGAGDYFFMARRDGQAGEEHGYQLGDVNHYRLRVVKRAMVEGSTVSFRTLQSFAQQDYYSNPSVYYAQGWSMVHFLMHHEDPEFRGLIPRLIKDFKDTKNFEKSTDKVFRKVDMDELDRQWIAWVLVQPTDDPLRRLALEFGDRLEPAELDMPEGWRPVYLWHVEHPDEPVFEGVGAGAGSGDAGDEAGGEGGGAAPDGEG
jgi:hypothetical protein